MKALLATVWLCALVAALAAVTQRTRAFALARQAPLDAPPLAALDTRVIDVVTLGHRGLWDDVAAIWLLQILAAPDVGAQDPDLVAAAVRQTTRHRPRIESTYLIACLTLGLEMRRPDLCERVSLDGLEALPESWRVPATQGFMHAFELKDMQKAALFYNIAATRPGAPAWLASYGAKLTGSNGLTPEELQAAFEQLVGGPESRRMIEFLKARRQAPPPEQQ